MPRHDAICRSVDLAAQPMSMASPAKQPVSPSSMVAAWREGDIDRCKP
jgi:hypothetical protein